MAAGLLTVSARWWVAKRIAAIAIVLLTLFTHPATAQIPEHPLPGGNWWRLCASLDMDFYNDRYYINHNTTCDGTTGTVYTAGSGNTGVQNFITGTGATFTRNSVGTYFNSSGVLTTASANVPRLDHSPSGNYAPLGVLIEEGRTNLVNYSSQYTGSNWSDNGAGAETINHATTAPDGTLAYSIAATANYKGWYYIGSSFSASTAYTISVFVKNVSGGSTVSIGSGSSCFGSGNAAATVSFNDITGAFSSVSAGITSYSAQQLANGWWRVNIVATTSSSCTAFNIQNYPLSGAVASENAFWGNQIEAGSFPTSYIPTSGSTVTRAAETFTVPTTAGGGSGWLTQGVGTLGATAMMPYIDVNNSHRLVDISDGTSSNNIGNSFSSSSGSVMRQYVFYSGSNVTGSESAISANTPYKEVITYNGSAIKGAGGGTIASLGASSIPSSLTQLEVGENPPSTNYLDGWVQRIWYQPVYQTNANSLKDYAQ